MEGDLINPAWIITFVLGCVLSLVGVVWTLMREDIKNATKGVRDLEVKLPEKYATKEELTRAMSQMGEAINAVRLEVAKGNAMTERLLTVMIQQNIQHDRGVRVADVPGVTDA